jgi:hypothetical protein
MKKLLFVLGLAVASVLGFGAPSWATETDYNQPAPVFYDLSQENSEVELPGRLVGGVKYTGVVPEVPGDKTPLTSEELGRLEQIQDIAIVLESIDGSPPKLTNQSSSEARLVSLMERVAKSLEGQTATSAGFNVDSEMQKVVIVTDQLGVELITKMWTPDPDFAFIDFQLSESFGYPQEEQWSGGGSFEATCTGAFPAMRGNAVGIVSARHCLEDEISSPISYDGLIIQGVTLPAVAIDDVAFVELLGPTTGLTRTSINSIEPMYLARNPLLGESVCHFGITSGKKCSTVRSRFQLAELMGEPVRNIAIVQHDVSEPGDSGGPWFSNTPNKTAVGIHRGVLTFEGAVRSFFTMITSISLVGATLILTGIQ